MNQTNEKTAAAAGLEVKTWRARIGLAADYPLHAATNVERAMEGEIADLRAAAATLLTAQPAGQVAATDRRRIFNPLDTPEFRERLDAYTKAMGKASLFDPASVNASFETRKNLIDFLEVWGAKFAAAERAAAPADLPDDWKAAIAEVERATRKFPTWPTDPLHAVAVLGEEFGELTKAVLQTTYEPHKAQPGELRTEAIQTAAMALRFLASLGRYEFVQCAQHEQTGAPQHSAQNDETT